MTIRGFGQVDGEEVVEVTLANAADVVLKLLSWGATVRSLEVPVAGVRREVTLGFETLEAYLANRGHFGAIAGRFANRIANARFTLDGREHRLIANQGGKHTLHGGGGPFAFGERNWRVVAQDATSATLALASPPGDGGFPGGLDVFATYRLGEGADVSLEIEARTDATTVINLAQHSYFNLNGGGDVLDHQLQVEADFYTPTDADLIPTGEVLAVAGSLYDFRSKRAIRNGAPHAPYDGQFALRGQAGFLRRAATLSVPDLGMEVWTTEPALQIYDAGTLHVTSPGIGGRRYQTHSGFCLECQNYPDAPNRPHFPSTVLRPGQVYRQRTEWRFRA